jgi:serpin B
MKRTIICFIIIELIAISCLAETQKDLRNPQEKLVTANNDFGFRLFSELTKNKPLDNIFISPQSITFALTMTYNGAVGETKEAMAKTLGIKDVALNQLNEANLALNSKLKSADPKVTLNITNSLWGKAGIEFKPDFLERNKKFYDAKITALNFADPKAANVINNWVKEKTNNKITEIIGQNDIDPIYTMLYLINAVYFKGKWQIEFKKAKTQERTFTLLNNKKKVVPMMSQSGNYSYLKGDKFQAISLPYGQGKVSMYIFLPDENSNLNEFLKTLNEKDWSNWMMQFRYMNGNIFLPRFKLEYEKSLKEILKSLGMEMAFNPDSADFSDMLFSPPALYINEVKHKTFVEVNEEGTEAAAVTSVTVEATSYQQPREFTMIVDRPFFCAIRDNETGSILFMGAITEPK